MSLRLGPILGEVAPDGIKVWFEADGEGPWLLHLASDPAMTRPVPGSPWPAMRLTQDSHAWIAEGRLPRPGVSYTYDVRAAEGKSLLPSRLRARTFRAAPAPGFREEFGFAFASCHGPFTWRTPRTRYRMWRRLDALRAEEDVRFLMLIGDQVYADDWYAKAMKRREPGIGELQEGYRSVYRRHWRDPAVARVLASLPTLMIWDDHEIEDGWGSSKRHFGARAQRVFEAARAVYREFEHSHNPQTFGEKAQHYAFGYGPAGFLVLDLRGHRRLDRTIADRPLMGARQWEDIKAWLAGPGSAFPLLFVVTSVPLLHAPAVFADLIGGRAGELDLRDQWTYKPFRREQQDLVSLLFRTANRSGQQIVVLGGDVHVGTVARIQSVRPEHARRPTLCQFTSSPIAHTPSALVNRLLRIADGPSVAVDDGIRGRIVHLYGERNVGIVRVKSDAAGRYYAVLKLHREGKRDPSVYSTGT